MTNGQDVDSLLLLTNNERDTILGMDIYWREVAKREDTQPLREELSQVIRLLGVRKTLAIIAAYAKLEKEVRRR